MCREHSGEESLKPRRVFAASGVMRKRRRRVFLLRRVDRKVGATREFAPGVGRESGATGVEGGEWRGEREERAAVTWSCSFLRGHVLPAVLAGRGAVIAADVVPELIGGLAVGAAEDAADEGGVPKEIPIAELVEPAAGGDEGGRARGWPSGGR